MTQRKRKPRTPAGPVLLATGKITDDMEKNLQDIKTAKGTPEQVEAQLRKAVGALFIHALEQMSIPPNN